MLDKLRSLFASAPKTLPQANETLTSAKAEIETLAAELTTRDEKIAALTAELAAAEAEGEKATAALATATEALKHANGALEAHAEIFELIGIQRPAGNGGAFDGKTFKAAFEAHVAKQTTLALAKTGHPPAHVPAATSETTTKPTAAELHAQWKAMKPGPERLAFFTAHEAQITAFERSGGTSA